MFKTGSNQTIETRNMSLIYLKPSLPPVLTLLQTLDLLVFWVCLRPESSCEHKRKDHCQKRATLPPRGKDPTSNPDCGEAKPGENLDDVLVYL